MVFATYLFKNIKVKTLFYFKMLTKNLYSLIDLIFFFFGKAGRSKLKTKSGKNKIPFISTNNTYIKNKDTKE